MLVMATTSKNSEEIKNKEQLKNKKMTSKLKTILNEDYIKIKNDRKNLEYVISGLS